MLSLGPSTARYKVISTKTRACLGLRFYVISKPKRFNFIAAKYYNGSPSTQLTNSSSYDRQADAIQECGDGVRLRSIELA